MQKKVQADRSLVKQGPASVNPISATDISIEDNHSGRKASDWTGDFG